MKRLSKSFKRFIVGLTAATMVFGSVGTALAANYPDVDNDSNLAGPVQRLTSLNIFEGFPDGTFRPGDTVTRAQYAAVAVRAMGLEAAAAASAGNTQFPDVNSSHWASGYVNVAASQGLIEGYPDGTFRPEGQVTHAESLAILVRMLGYEHLNLPGAWPAKYIAKAAELGLTKGVTLSANLPATRGELAIMTDNSLDVPLVIQAGSNNEWIVSGTQNTDKRTLLTDRLDLEELKDVRITGNWLTDSALDRDEVEIDGKAYKVRDSKSNVYDLLGVKATVWVNEDDKELITATVKDTTVIYDLVKTEADVEDVRGGRIELDSAGNVRVANDAQFFVNNDGLGNADPIAEGLWGRFVRVDGQIALAELYNFNRSGAAADYIVTSVDEDAERINARQVNGNRTLRLDGEDYVVRTTAGGEIELGDIHEDDVLQYVENDDVFVLWVSHDEVTGKLERLGRSAANPQFRIDGKNYNAMGNNLGNYPRVTFTLNGDEYERLSDLEDIKDLVGEDVTLRLDSNGNVVRIEGDVEASSGLLYGYVTRLTSGNGDYVRLVTADDKVASYEYTDDTDAYNANGDEIDFVDLDTQEVVGYKLFSDGTLDEIRRLGVESGDIDRINDKNDSIELDGDPTIYYGSNSTAVFERDGSSANAKDWTLIRDAKDAEGVTVDLYIDRNISNRVVAVVIDDALDFGDEIEYGVLLDKFLESKWQWKVDSTESGLINKIEAGDNVGKTGDIVSFRSSGGKAANPTVVWAGGDWEGDTEGDDESDVGVALVTKNDKGFLSLQFEDEGDIVTVPVSSKAVVYDGMSGVDGDKYSPKSSELEKIDQSQIGEDDLIAFVRGEDDGPIMVIILLKTGYAFP